MRRKFAYVLAALVIVVALPLGAANESINYGDINKIKAEGMRVPSDGLLQHTDVMQLNSWLSDVYGPRLAGSPMYDKAAQWAMAKMKEWGLVNVHIEPWADKRNFDRGWTNDKFYMEAITANGRFPIPGTPTAWTPGTNGLVTGEVVLVDPTATTEEALAQYKGKLKGKWILTMAIPDVPAMWDPPSKRYTSEQLSQMENAGQPQPEFGMPNPNAAGRGGPGGAPAAPAAAAGRQGAPGTPAAAAAPQQAQRGAPPAAAQQGQRGNPPAAQGQRAGQPAPAQAQAAPGGGRGGFNNARNEFFRAEGALGLISTAPRGHGMYVISGNRTSDPTTTLPAIVIAAEQYGRMARNLEKGVPVSIEADIKNTYYPNPQMYNIVGEIPGTDKADEVVLLGGHFDCWHAATGAADNGVGAMAMMEAMRILKVTGVKLRRTVRVCLWDAEEQGLLGSQDYVTQHYASRQAPAGGGPGGGGGGGGRGGAQGPITIQPPKPDYDKVAAYFNIDNGTGALRGIYLQGNDAVGPIFREWVEPFRSLGMTTVTIRNTSGTDHQSFDAVGLPGFQFIQDEIEYNTIIHHTNMDTYERLQPRDCMQMSTIAAGFAYLAANRDQKLPRKAVVIAPATNPTQH